MAEEDIERGGDRSGRYPGVSLGDALAAAEALYKAERQSPVTADTAVQKMGYKSMSGTARVMVGALRQYGLVEKTAVGQFRLSRLAIEALHGSDEQKAAAVKAAALNPPLFAELARTHLSASLENITSYLIVSKHFIDTGGRNAARAFRETMELARINDTGYSDNMAPPKSEEYSRQAAMPHIASTASLHPPTMALSGSGDALPPLSVVLSVPRGVRAEIRITGKDVRRDDLERLKKQIDFLMASFDDEDTD